MRLLHVPSLELCVIPDDQVPPYAILSHTWADEEITFNDLSQLRRHDARKKRGWDKIQKSCAVAKSLDLDFIWIDTCCIDKSSSAELSEAINSMFRWYEEARLCLACASPFCLTGTRRQTLRTQRRFDPVAGSHEDGLCRNPLPLVKSYSTIRIGKSNSREIRSGSSSTISQGYQRMCSKHQMTAVHNVASALMGFRLRKNELGCEPNRTTTREEDASYCLLGIFDINMPLLYGEGATKAFRRLQDEIIKSTDDESLYAWSCPIEIAGKRQFWGLLADSPAAFGNYNDMIPRRSRYLTRSSNRTVTVSNRGLRLDLFVTPFPKDTSRTNFLTFLDCDMARERSSSSLSPVIILQRTAWDNNADMARIRPDILGLSIMNNVVLPDELATLLCTGSGTGSTLQQPELVQIFIPHKYTAARPPSGIVFHPEVHHPLNKLSLSVRPRSPTWQYFIGMKGSAVERSYGINFEQNPIPAVDELKEPKVLDTIGYSCKFGLYSVLPVVFPMAEYTLLLHRSFAAW
ncbi:HET domain protein [Metarhizium acridum CQMa 102]|uniref:HET domain protein n=2 Tax=Metarhizium acridum TaxID=92637 RepID=E9DZJ4_METAQ|nr:HET domain protein [Metarhizium acridum CQMa 102]EFY90926.1 HET domain protein [Metarhizium acridum CQMa 102]